MRSKMMPPSVAMRTYEAHKKFYDKLQMDVAKAVGNAKIEPDEALASLVVSTPADGHRQALHLACDPDLRLPGQPELVRRRAQRRLHRRC